MWQGFVPVHTACRQIENGQVQEVNATGVTGCKIERFDGTCLVFLRGAEQKIAIGCNPAPGDCLKSCRSRLQIDSLVQAIEYIDRRIRCPVSA